MLLNVKVLLLLKLLKVVLVVRCLMVALEAAGVE
jgi:hypothetical protein